MVDGMEIRDYLNKYPVINSDWVYIDNTINVGGIGDLYELIDALNSEYYKKTYKYSFGDPFVEEMNKKVMGECKALYSGVKEYFVRRLCMGDSEDMNRSRLDPWHRVLMVYHGEVCNMELYKNMNNYNSVYNRGYVVKDVRVGGYICCVSVTSVEGEGVYCLDIYE